jgi:hypothetical protein
VLGEQDVADRRQTVCDADGIDLRAHLVDRGADPGLGPVQAA